MGVRRIAEGAADEKPFGDEERGDDRRAEQEPEHGADDVPRGPEQFAVVGLPRPHRARSDPAMRPVMSARVTRRCFERSQSRTCTKRARPVTAPTAKSAM